MLGYFLKLKNLIPYSCYETGFDIPVDLFYKNGKRVVLLDIDNTLIPYDMDKADEKTANLLNKLGEMGFIVYFASNNHKPRVANFASDFDYKYMANALKPFPKVFKWILKDSKVTKKEVLVVGDQLITDCLGSTRLGLDTILVRPLKKKSEKWYTRLNRHNEQIVLKRMKKKYPSVYREIMTNHEDK